MKCQPDILLYKSSNPAELYKSVLKQIYSQNFKIKGDKKISNETRAVLELSDFDKFLKVSIKRNSIESNFDYSKYGDKNNDKMKEECAYYYETIFGSGKFDKALKMLKEDSSTKKAIITINEAPKPKNGKIPCMTCLWARIINGKLTLSCHMRANNAYRIMLMNIQINQAIQKEFAKRLNLPLGNYYHFVDSLHLYKKELNDVKSFLESFRE